jgi:isopenicillin N synthase-like dioxygenase
VSSVLKAVLSSLPVSYSPRAERSKGSYNEHMPDAVSGFSQVRIIDIGPLLDGTGRQRVANDIALACAECGFFYIVGHGIEENLQYRLESLSRQFFAQDLEAKMAIRMELSGRAWRGYFPVGGELTSGKPDLKEGIYFGAELSDDHPLVKAGTPLHGQNLFPADMPEFRLAVLDYLGAMTTLGHALMAGIALSLGLDASYFANRYTTDPLILFRIFNYPPDLPRAGPTSLRGSSVGARRQASAKATAVRRSFSKGGSASEGGPEPQWGVGEHTDYGLLTMLKQDESGGLEVKSRSRWIPAPPIRGSFVCNIGDMLDRMTGGRYRSTPHRVRNLARRDRLSFPFFFDPNFAAEIKPIDLPDAERVASDRQERWDRASVHEFRGTYGDYVLGKVSKVFPQLTRPAAGRNVDRP